MSKLDQKFLPLKKVKNKFILRLNRDLYKDEIVEKAVFEDKDWIKKTSSSNEEYVCLELKTSETKDALNWFNYLIYLHKG